MMVSSSSSDVCKDEPRLLTLKGRASSIDCAMEPKEIDCGILGLKESKELFVKFVNRTPEINLKLQPESIAHFRVKPPKCISAGNELSRRFCPNQIGKFDFIMRIKVFDHI